MSALLVEGARLDVKDADGDTPQQVICTQSKAAPAAKPLVLATIVRHRRLELLAREVLAMARGWDHVGMFKAIRALMKAGAAAWAGSAAVRASEVVGIWTARRHVLDYFREPGTGRTALGVAAAAGVFRNCELCVNEGASPLELDCGGRVPRQLGIASGSWSMPKWFESMPVVYRAGHSKRRYLPVARLVLLCCRFCRGRPNAYGGEMHPDDWCIPQHDAYRILHFVGPELWGSVWPGPPRGWRGERVGLSARPVRRVPVRVEAGGAMEAPAVATASGCAQCGTTAGKLMACTRCRAASYCSGKCQKLHYPAHKAGCRAALRASQAA